MTDSASGSWARLDTLRRALPGRKVDEEGELLTVPLWLTFAWLVLGVLTVLEALNDLFGLGPDWLYDNWIHNIILGTCAGLVIAPRLLRAGGPAGLAGLRGSAGHLVLRQHGVGHRVLGQSQSALSILR